MKKIVLIVALLAAIQNWSNIKSWLKPAPDFNSVNNSNVVLYATAWCGYCAKARKLLSQHGIIYQEYNIEQSSIGRSQYKQLGGQGVPVLLIDGEVVHGYNPQRIVELIKGI